MQPQPLMYMDPLSLEIKGIIMSGWERGEMVDPDHIVAEIERRHGDELDRETIENAAGLCHYRRLIEELGSPAAIRSFLADRAADRVLMRSLRGSDRSVN